LQNTNLASVRAIHGLGNASKSGNWRWVMNWLVVEVSHGATISIHDVVKVACGLSLFEAGRSNPWLFKSLIAQVADCSSR
jgi:hypothetical protein